MAASFSSFTSHTMSMQGLNFFEKRRGSEEGKRKISTTGWVVLIVIFTAGGIGSYYGIQYLMSLSTQAPPAPFSLKIYDGMTLDVLKTSKFDFTLYGTTDLTDWLSFKTIRTGSDLSLITAADLDTAKYTDFVVAFNGTIPNSDFEGAAKLGDRVYYMRWATLLPTGENKLYAYWQPSSAGLLAIDAKTCNLLNFTAGVTIAHNCTFIASTNSSQVSAAYTSGPDYQAEVGDSPSIQLTFNSTVALQDFSISGCQKVRVSATVIQYTFSMLSSVPISFRGTWADDVTGLKITACRLMWTATALCSANA